MRARNGAGADAAVADAVRSRIASDAALGAEALEVSVQGGAVTLRGVVASKAERSSAERLAWTVAGVAAVNNLLKVK
jgi:osmotically-inducible protein OsmY